ncbi:hypothetical protein LPTSP4_29840 [Leptospira ryugenii]|uniref:DUF6285 domain-containing protein n=1 Tax=Leptospira ryugenii TaxID=1917863 RepID=A0A2P2E3K1_9LEPT|nr:DUF6285 domain-containing protein [Leptospira ryugenii]GBF51447.1 hypothetical protein LPTSP4_29840 [Leptospira ryugenii]
MQYRPNAKDLLIAIQDFLMKDLLPKLENEELLSYKALVSWNMLGVISREWEKEESFVDSEIQSLTSLSELQSELIKLESNSMGNIEKSRFLSEQYAHLAKLIREKKIDDCHSEIWKITKNHLKNNLSISNPRFGI